MEAGFKRRGSIRGGSLTGWIVGTHGEFGSHAILHRRWLPHITADSLAVQNGYARSAGWNPILIDGSLVFIVIVPPRFLGIMIVVEMTSVEMGEAGGVVMIRVFRMKVRKRGLQRCDAQQYSAQRR